MTRHLRTPLAALTAACLLTVALPGTATAQKVKNPPPAAATASEVSVSVPTIEAVGANLDEATLRDIVSGNIVGNADALANLDATSITIPEIVVTFSAGEGDLTTSGTMTMSDIVLTDVADGVAASIAMGGTTMQADGVDSTMGAATASQFDIGAVLGLYGLLDAGGQTELQTVYRDFSFAGGLMTTPEVSCTIGAVTAAEFKARPLTVSFVDIMAMAAAMEGQGDSLSPELTGQLLRLYADMFTAFESSPVEFGGIDCAGLDEQGRALTVAMNGMSMAGMRPGLYPAITVDQVEIAVEGDGAVSLGNLVFKEMDLSGPIAVLQTAPEAIEPAWFEANARALIPAFAGFSFADLAIDVPDPDAPDTRIKASIGAFDLSLGGYLNGIPTDIATSASNIVVDLPTDTGEAFVDQLRGFGVTSIDAGFALAASWDEATETITVEEASVTGANLATVVLSGAIGRVSKAMFGLDEDAALLAAMDMVIKHLKLDLTDAGLSDLVLATVAAEQNSDPAALRPAFAGLAEGTVIQLLAGAAEAQKVGAAINAFVAGKASHLTIDMTATVKPGLSLLDFAAAETDPTVLLGKVAIDATAE